MSDNKIENNSKNFGLQVVENNGTINYSLESKAKAISILSPVIKELSEEAYNNSVQENDLIPFSIDEKIKYNIVSKYKLIFDKYKIYYYLCENILKKISDNSRKYSKEKLLNNINDLYYETIGEFIYNKQKLKNSFIEISEIDLIREDKIADEIIEKIKIKLNLKLEDTILEEDKDLGLNIVLCYAFMECKILEKPKKGKK